jgi:hypothetical protein
MALATVVFVLMMENSIMIECRLSNIFSCFVTIALYIASTCQGHRSIPQLVASWAGQACKGQVFRQGRLQLLRQPLPRLEHVLSSPLP